MRSNGRPHTVAARAIKPLWNGGHWQVGLYRDKKRYPRFVHHLVLEAFVKPRPDGAKGLHRDDDPHNNHFSNLYWGTTQSNALDRVRNGRDHNASKTHCKRGHLLAGANLVPWGEKENYRRCLACNRAITLANYRGKNDEGYRKRLADFKYEEIMGIKS